MGIDLSVPDLATLHRRRSQKWATHPDPDVLVATIAEMDFPVAEPIARVLHEAIDRDDLGYSPLASRPLAEAFAAFASRRLSWSVDPEQVKLVPDVMVGLVELCRWLLEPGDGVAFAVPAYPPFFSELPEARVRLHEIPLQRDGSVDLERLRESFAGGVRAFVLVNPHNPTGRVLPPDELRAIADLCASSGVWVLADEIHAPLVLPGATHTPFLELSDAAREWGIALTSASKAFNLAGLKGALVVTASEHAREAAARLPAVGDRAGLLSIVASEAAFTEGDEWLDAVLEQLDANRTLLGERLAAELPAVRWTPPEATYLAWLDCRGLELGDDPGAVFLERGRVALSRGPDYGAAGAGFARLNFATSPELVAEAVGRMAAAAG